jgi:cytochrome P450
MTTQHPPGIEFTWGDIFRLAISGQKFDPLAFSLQISDEYGGFVRNKFGFIEIYQIADPELAHAVLVERANEFHKGAIMKRAFGPFVGNGLLTSEGDFWKRQRRLAQPAFHHRRIISYADTMVQHADAMLNTWRDGASLDIDREMMKVTLGIVNKTLFNADVSAVASRVGELMTDVLDAANENLNAIVALPASVPTPRRLRQKRKIAELDAIIQGFVDERRRTQEDTGDLLSMLLQAQDDDGSGMTDRQLRDEVMTLFLAGHETTANALTFALYLLAENPQAKATLQQEVDSALQGRLPGLNDLNAMPFTEQVIKETLRLYPAAPAVARSPYHDLQLGGYTVRKDATMQVSMWAMHRSSRYWQQPSAFMPERFSPENEKAIPRYAYLPFGAGPRVCIGNQFAMMEARLLLAAIVSRFDFAMAPGAVVEVEQLMTLRPRGGVRMVLRQREQARHPVS